MTDEPSIGGRDQPWEVVTLSERVYGPFRISNNRDRLDRATTQSGLTYAWTEGGPALPAHSNARQRQLRLKRILDVVLSSFGLLLLSTPMIMIAAAIKMTSPGPVFFLQLRPGLHGKPFRIIKFRSLYVDQADAIGTTQTTADDARVTKLGAFLRRTSLDELPQLFNVLAGDMSLVGPRPHPPNMLAAGHDYRQLVPYYDLRLSMRPGLSGWAQANGYRGPTGDANSAKARIDHDLAYIQNFSVLLDIKIIILTLWKHFLRGTGI